MDNVENGMILHPKDPTLRADHAKTKEDCMTQFSGHGQPIIHVFETAITLNMVKSVSPFFQPYWTQFREPYPYNNTESRMINKYSEAEICRKHIIT